MDLLQSTLPYLISGISVGGQYALIAIGYTMVYGILRLINFAHGDVCSWWRVLSWSTCRQPCLCTSLFR